MEVHFLPQAHLSQFLHVLADHARVVVPVKVGKGQYKFRDLNEVSTEDVALEYLRTMVPPKKYFFPPEEVLYRYSTETGYEEPVLVDEPPILFGLHPCDLHGIRVTDTFFGDRYQDRHYLRRREQSRIIGLGCMPDEKCFCQSNRTDHIEDIYDLFLWEVEEGYLTLVRTPAGHEMLHWQRDLFSFASREHINQHQAYLERRREAFTRQMPTSDLPDLLRFEQDSPAWKDLGNSCFACGACSMVCPTCTCFNVYDKTDLSGESGERVRRWDSCLFRDFTRIAGEEHTRPERSDRVSNRYYHKEQGFVEQFGMPSCVGCGRCIDSCIAKIDITQVFAKVRSSCGR